MGVLNFRFIATSTIQLVLFYYICREAFNIRMHAINVYGLVIHEFDPWFNFRATQYLADNGLARFFKWYDYMSWSPLGRPVGTTIYPGMQMVSVFIWHVLNDYLHLNISLNDVCCFVPVWFGVIATVLVGTMTYIATGGSRNKSVIAAGVMSIIPAHIMRSVGGGYDNESVAISCMCLAFTTWMWAVSGSGARSSKSSTFLAVKHLFWGAVAGLAYMCMVAAWGGYIFVLNIIGLHAFVMVLLGRYSEQLYWCYTAWYLVGTAGALQVPVVGMSPLKSLEQLAPAGVFIMMQLIKIATLPVLHRAMGYGDSDAAADAEDEKKDEKKGKVAERAPITPLQQFILIGQVFTVGAILAGIVIAMLWPTGYFGPLSSRVRGLFVRHTRTGNPLVDSVAEHQPASPQAYWQFLHMTCYVAPVGFAMAAAAGVLKPLFALIKIGGSSAAKKTKGGAPSTPTTRPRSGSAAAAQFSVLASLSNNSNAMLFVTLYAAVTYYFSNKMNRLMLLMAPISAVLTGMALGTLVDAAEDDVQDCADMVLGAVGAGGDKNGDGAQAEASSGDAKSPSKASKAAAATPTVHYTNLYEALVYVTKQFYNSMVIRIVRKFVIGYLLVFVVAKNVPTFYQYSQEMAVNMSNPSIMFQARLQDGTVIMVDDYREAYWWLRDHTPQDARVMAWWDYGYQITGIGNRTTIADGNTWNHEHIALLGRCLTSPEKRAHNIIKHLADYVLIWAGGGGDDLAKSPHMARIANSVFDDVCPGDPTCAHFGFYDRKMTPTPSMAESLLYKLHANMMVPDVKVDPKLFKEVFMSKYHKVRIYKVIGVSQASKNYTSDPANRICDAPGSWHCSGVYPPALDKLLAKRKAFGQLEDFNNKKDAETLERERKYNEEYMRRMNGGAGSGGAGGGGGGASPEGSKARSGGKKKSKPKKTKA